MEKINITSGEYLNNYLKGKGDGIFIPFNEAMIQGDLSYPLFDEEFIGKRIITHNISKLNYLENLESFINIKNEINNIKTITLWFGKDAFCIINLLTVLVYLEDNNYRGKVSLNLVDDYSNEILESNIDLVLEEFKNIYLNLVNRKLIKSEYSFINDGLTDYLYVTSDDNHILDYIKENYNTLSEKELIINILKQSYKYGLGDIQIKCMIDKIKSDS